MNRTAKGTRNEKKCEDELIERGYTTWRTFRSKYRQLDLFDIFDVCGVSADGSHMLFIQVKSNKCDKSVRDKISVFKMPDCCHKEVWIWIDRKGWEKERL